MPAQLVTQSGENYVVHGTVDGSGQIAHTIRASPATVSHGYYNTIAVMHHYTLNLINSQISLCI